MSEFLALNTNNYWLIFITKLLIYLSIICSEFHLITFTLSLECEHCFTKACEDVEACVVNGGVAPWIFWIFLLGLQQVIYR